MRTLSVLPLILLAAACPASPARAQELVRVEAKLWNPSADASVKSSTDLLTGTKINLQDDLHLDNDARLPYIKLSLGGKQRLVASAMQLKLDNESLPDVTFNFGGSTYTVGVPVKTVLEAEIYRVAWEADWISTDLLRVGTIIGAEIFDTRASLENSVVGKKEQEVTVPVPIVGLQGEIGLPFGLAAYGELAGLWLQSGGREGSFIESELGAKYVLFRILHVSAGWRQINVSLQDDQNKASMALRGLVFGAGLQF